MASMTFVTSPLRSFKLLPTKWEKNLKKYNLSRLILLEFCFALEEKN